jgi:hypothetical protein
MVRTHDKVTIFTNPKTGTKSFNSWGVFPSGKKEIRRIIMAVTLAHPLDRAIAHWDYLDRIKILRSGGKDSKELGYEIGRMLTPYGSNFKEGWQFTWKVDVTDFSAFLRDSVEIEYIHTGYESPDLGWDLTIQFYIDYGPPIASFVKMDALWNDSFQYGNPDNAIEKTLAPIDIVRAEGSSFGRLRIQHTGHGMDRPSGCSEFCSRWREVLFDDKIIDHRDMWKECGDNPLYPQGGTWIFDRAYWCPGDLQPPDIIDVPLSRDKHSIDIQMEPFTANNVKQPNEAIAAYFFQYGKPTHENDVAIEEIIAPNNEDNYNRFNPIGFDPQIKIRNLGSQKLKQVTIKYQTKGFKENTYEWNGELGFYESTLIILPGKVSAKSGVNVFSVVLSEPNGVKDEWPNDNKMESEFNDVPTLPNDIVIDFLTNNHSHENALYIVNSSLDTVLMKGPDMLQPATQYSDTLNLPEDNYNMVLTDSMGNGLEFWFMPKAGFGRLRLKDIEGNFIHLFESDCGNGHFYSFRTDKDAVVDTTQAYLSVYIFPRMVKDSLTIYTTTHRIADLKVRITKDGEYMEQHEYTNIRDSARELDITHLEKGRYVMEIYIDGEHKMNRRFNKR